MAQNYDFYGVTIRVESASSDLEEEVRRDFAFFHRPEGSADPEITIRMDQEPPDYEGLPDIDAAFYTPRNICYRQGRVTYIDYFGRGLARFERDAGRCTIQSADYDMVHEIAFLFILSTVGQKLDARGMSRVHALGVSYRRQGMLLLLPSGGGKSTMALQLLNQPEFLLLGEDTPLVDRRGMLLPFPLRLGIKPGSRADIPARYLRTVRRMEFDPKTLIDIDYIRDRLGEPALPAVLLVGERNLGSLSEIVPLPRRKAFFALVKYSVVGLGIYQGLEFLLERGAWELVSKVGTVSSRMYNCIRLLSHARPYTFVLGRDIEKNTRTFVEFVHDQLGRPESAGD
jgi:hypothetical protein